jgi:hypothetical protein
MNAEVIKKLVEDSGLPKMQKNVMLGFLTRAEEKENQRSEDKKLIEQVASVKNLSEIILSTDQVKIYTVSGTEEWDVKYPYRFIFLKDGKWDISSMVSPTLDIAFFVYLEQKYVGVNS